jgi:predicted PurR-regulated permease PerM
VVEKEYAVSEEPARRAKPPELSTEEEKFVRKVMEATIRTGIVVLLALWSFKIFSPFLAPVVWGMIIAVATYGLYGGLRTRLNGRDGLAATVFTLLALAVLITPTVMLSESLLGTAQTLSTKMQAGEIEIPPPPARVADWPLVGERLHQVWQLASQNIEAALIEFGPQVKAFSRWLLSAAVGTGLGILAFMFAIIIAGIFLANAAACGRTARAIAHRLAGERGHAFVDLAQHTINSVARGVLGIALIQTFFLAMGLIVAGVPGAGLLSVITMIFAVAQIPMLLLYLPVIAFYFSIADPTAAIAFAVWSVFFCFADGVRKPILLGRGLSVPMIVILIGVVGGMVANGIVGLFVGPIILGFSYSLFMVWLYGDGALRPAEDAEAPTQPASREG